MWREDSGQCAAEPEAAESGSRSKGAQMSDQDYFEDQLTRSNVEFWRRLPPLDFSGLSVLDLGCGHGALSVDIARRGATEVVGVDINEEPVLFAQTYVKREFPDVADRITFMADDVANLTRKFDVIVSKDSFEHIEHLDSMMLQLQHLLRPGGHLLAGFGPLYFSPFGDHGRYLNRRVPWLPALMPEPLLLKLATLRYGRAIRSPLDLGLNKLTPARFRRIVQAQGWRVQGMKYNGGDQLLLKPMHMLRTVPPLERYFTTSIYANLQVP